MRPAVEKKAREVEQLYSMIKDAKVVGLIRLKKLPDRILQDVRNKLRGKVGFRVAKKAVIQRALEKAACGSALLEHLDEPVCLFWTSEMTPYQLFMFLKRNKGVAAAKPGQIAPFDIVVPAGETDLPPGPALTELKMAKINAQVRGGKIVVAKDSVVAKAGERITGPVASALQKLKIYPFEIGAELIVAQEDGVVYLPEVLDVEPEDLVKEFQRMVNESFALSINANIPTPANIDYLISKSFTDAVSLAYNANVYSTLSIERLISEAYAQSQSLERITK